MAANATYGTACHQAVEADLVAEAARAAEVEYYALVAELGVIEKRTGLYLTDECVDAENAGVPRGHPDFWQNCIFAARDAAGFRAEEAGYDINDLIGRRIY